MASTTRPADPTDVASVTTKRIRKQDYHGLTVISLRSRGLAISTIPRDSLGSVTRKPLEEALHDNNSEILSFAGHKLITYDMATDESVVRFLAEWMRRGEAGKSLEVALRNGDDAKDKTFTPAQQLSNFHRTINHFRDMSTYNSDIYDSLVDWFIQWLRGQQRCRFQQDLHPCAEEPIFRAPAV